MDESYEPPLTEQRTVYGLQLQVSPGDVFLHYVSCARTCHLAVSKACFFWEKSPLSITEGVENIDTDDR
jgi:hypothetical protein